MGYIMSGLVCQTMKFGLGSLAGPVKGFQQGSGAICLLEKTVHGSMRSALEEEAKPKAGSQL